MTTIAPIHPGEILMEEFLEPLQISQNRLAVAIGVPPRRINEIVHGIVLSLNGSISAEHGIGQLKRDELARIRPAIEIDLMRRIKRAFDPANIMNPGKVIAIE